MNTIRVEIHKKFIPTSVKKEQKLNIPIVNYISLKSKTKSKQFRIKHIISAQSFIENWNLCTFYNIQ